MVVLLYQICLNTAPSEQRRLRDKEEKSNQTTVTGMSDDHLFILVVERTISCAREHPNMYGLTPNDRGECTGATDSGRTTY